MVSQEPFSLGNKGNFGANDTAPTQRATELNIIISAISVWNTLRLTKAVEYQKG
jgi:TnpA family transposase